MKKIFSFLFFLSWISSIGGLRPSEEENTATLSNRVAKRVEVLPSHLVQPFADALDKEDDLVARQRVTDIIFHGKSPYAAYDTLHTSAGREKSSDEALHNIGSALEEAMKFSGLKGNEAGEKTEESSKLVLQNLSSQLDESSPDFIDDPSPEVHFPGGLFLHFRNATHWGDSDKRIVSIALKKQYKNGPLTCMCRVEKEQGQRPASIVGPVLSETGCDCYNGTLSDLGVNLTEQPKQVQENSKEKVFTSAVMSEVKTMQEEEKNKTKHIRGADKETTISESADKAATTETSEKNK